MSEKDRYVTHPIRRPGYVVHELVPLGYVPQDDCCSGCGGQLHWSAELVVGDFFKVIKDRGGLKIDDVGAASTCRCAVFWEGLCPVCNEIQGNER